jgi:hypothetical protein
MAESVFPMGITEKGTSSASSIDSLGSCVFSLISMGHFSRDRAFFPDPAVDVVQQAVELTIKYLVEAREDASEGG